MRSSKSLLRSGRLYVAIAAIITLTVLLDSCSKSPVKSVVIGWIYSDENDWQVNALSSIRLFEKRNPKFLQCENGVRIPYKITPINTKQTPEAAVRSFRTSINSSNMDIAVVTLISSSAIPLAWVAERAQIPLVAAASTNVEISRQLKFVRSTSMDDKNLAKLFSEYIADNYGAAKVAIIFDITNPYNRDIAGYFRQFLLTNKVEVTLYKGYVKDKDNFDEIASKAAQSGSKLFILPNFFEDVIALAEPIKKRIPDAQFFGTDAWSLNKLEGVTALEGSLVLDQWHSGMAKHSESSASFLNEIKHLTDVKVAGGIVRAFDSLLLIKRALCQSDEINALSITRSLQQIKSINGIGGLYHYQSDGSLSKPMALVKMKNGHFDLEKVISLQ